jgi:hypothetical protein
MHVLQQFLTLTEKQQGFENKFGKILGPTREDVPEQFRLLHNDNFRICSDQLILLEPGVTKSIQ